MEVIYNNFYNKIHKKDPTILRWFNFLTYNNAVAKKARMETTTATPKKIIKITVNQGRKAQPAIEEPVKVIKRFIYNI